ncbi:MAG: TlpA family protein disulfide reductase [Alcaligenaceae bacterium]|jgi:peroxiredoxin|nr:TlpA family protein disulfide reductase [Alcaligenaceae bacterium]
MKKSFISIIAVAAIAILAFFTYNSLFTSKAAPQVTFNSIDGRTFETDDLRGKVTMVKFWATDCVTCMKQMPDTVAHHEQYQPQGFETIAVAMKHDKVDAIQRLIDDRGYKFTIVHDADGSIAEAFGEVRFTPVAFLYDRNGKLVKSYIGDYDTDLFIADLERALAQS